MVMTLFYISADAQTFAENTSSENLTTVKSESENFQDNYADDLPWHARRFKISAGAFFPVNNTEVQVGTNNGNAGTKIDLEDDLGFKKSSSSFMANFEWRISRRSRLGSEYFILNRGASKTLQRQIEFKDETYEINTRVSSFFDVQIARIYYGYAFLSKPKFEAGLLIGAHVLFGDVGIRAEANQASTEYRNNFAFTAPLPDVGIWGEFVLGKRFGLYANANYLSAKVDNISGRIISYNISLLYNVYENFSLTAGYTGLNFRIEDYKERVNGFLKWGYNGPSITATYTFGNHVKLYKH